MIPLKATQISTVDARNNQGILSQNTVNHGDTQHPSHAKYIEYWSNPKALYALQRPIKLYWPLGLAQYR